jgi:hypothetical protein
VATTVGSGEERCGICGLPLGEHEGVPEHDGASDVGKDVEYVVTEIRGILAFFRSVSDEATVHRTPASVLVHNLQLGADDLVGRRFLCHEVRDAYGTTQSGFRLSDANTDQQ